LDLQPALIGKEHFSVLCRGNYFYQIRTFFFKTSIDFRSNLIYIYKSILQGWDYLAFSSPSAPSPAFFMRRKITNHPKPTVKSRFSSYIPIRNF